MSSKPRSKPPPILEYTAEKPVAESTPSARASNIRLLPNLPKPDPQRGYEAAVKVAQGGRLDARYRPASRRVLAIIVALPFVIVLGKELYERRFMGKQQRVISKRTEEER